jgi:hypothetical protein
MNNPSEAEVRRQYRELKEAAREARHRSMDESRKADGFDKMAAGLRMVHPFLADDGPLARRVIRVPRRPGLKPKGWNAVEMALNGQEGRAYSSAQIHRRLVSLGWEEDDDEGRARVRAAINRGHRLGRLSRTTTANGIRYALVEGEATKNKGDAEAGLPDLS